MRDLLRAILWAEEGGCVIWLILRHLAYIRCAQFMIGPGE